MIALLSLSARNLDFRRSEVFRFGGEMGGLTCL